jgi:hypothetical protein
MASTLKQFKARAFARPGVKKAYDDLAEEFAFLGEVLRARAETPVAPPTGRSLRPLLSQYRS